jgi:type IV secretory pathway VirB2 component (pilin)
MLNKINKKIIMLIFFFPSLALAGGETPVGDGLQYIISSMYGATGVAIATIAVMVVGLLCLFSLLRWVMLGYTVVGISIIFGAGAIVNGITSFIRF